MPLIIMSESKNSLVWNEELILKNGMSYLSDKITTLNSYSLKLKEESSVFKNPSQLYGTVKQLAKDNIAHVCRLHDAAMKIRMDKQPTHLSGEELKQLIKITKATKVSLKYFESIAHNKFFPVLDLKEARPIWRILLGCDLLCLMGSMIGGIAALKHRVSCLQSEFDSRTEHLACLKEAEIPQCPDIKECDDIFRGYDMNMITMVAITVFGIPLIISAFLSGAAKYSILKCATKLEKKTGFTVIAPIDWEIQNPARIAKQG